MTRAVLYVAAPLRPTEEEIHQQFCILARDPAGSALAGRTATKEALRANLDRAMRWLAWLRRSFPETTFIAPWIASVLAGADDADPAQREAGIADALAVIERCDGIVLCGERISDGMRREMEHGGVANHQAQLRLSMQLPAKAWPQFAIYNLTCSRNPEPPLTSGEMTWTMSLDELNDVARTLWRG